MLSRISIKKLLINKTFFYRYFPEKTEAILQQIIFPTLTCTSNPLITYSCLSLLKCYLSYIKIQNENFIENLTLMILSYMLNNNSSKPHSLIIQTQSATLLPELFKQKNYNFTLLTANLKSILNIYFKLLNEIDLDKIVFCLKKFIEEFQVEIFSFAAELGKELVESFRKFVVKDDLGKISDHEERIASRILKALMKLVSLSDKLQGSATAKELELICFPLILWNIRNNFGCIFAKDNLNLLYEIVSLEFQFEKNMWVVFEELVNSLLVEKSIF
jgi:hypothetical protein